MKVNVPGTTFQRDTKSMALLQSDRKSADDYRLKRKLLDSNKEDINNMKEEITEIKSSIEEIKQLLRGLVK